MQPIIAEEWSRTPKEFRDKHGGLHHHYERIAA